ncbi:MAG: diguanylate cyclase [Clostridiales bacterium]|nr:diguanylate cyclase [Clostridiales bacterium]
MAKGAFCDYTASKLVVLEDGRWGVYLGYRSIRPFIDKFAGRGSEAADARKALELLQEYTARHDGVTGILNAGGFADAAGAEVSRSRRYGNVFSVAVFEVRHFGGKAPFGRTARLAGKVLAEGLRDIDIACRWKGMRFLALMPETGAAAARRAANRICGEFNRQTLAANTGGSYYAIYAGISQFDLASLESTVKRCVANLRLAKRLRRARPVAGIFASRRGYKAPKCFSVKYI